MKRWGDETDYPGRARMDRIRAALKKVGIGSRVKMVGTRDNGDDDHWELIISPRISLRIDDSLIEIEQGRHRRWGSERREYCGWETETPGEVQEVVKIIESLR